MALVSLAKDWQPVFARALALPIDDQMRLYAIYNRLGRENPLLYNHECMEKALAIFANLTIMDGAEEYEEAMAGLALMEDNGG